MITKKSGKKGFETEELIRSYFLATGFFVLRGVQLRDGSDDLTDIDVWTYERSGTIARRRLVIDIKDNAQPKAAERLFFIKGLAEVLQVEASGVVTSDPRKSLRDLAKRHSVLWIDNTDLQRLKASQKLAVGTRMSEEALFAKVAEVDKSRSSRQIKEGLAKVKSSVADRFGLSSANTSLDASGLFARMACEAHPSSDAARLAMRLTYFSVSIMAISFDFAFGEFALRPAPERVQNLVEGIRLGDDPKGANANLRWTEAAIRDFAPEAVGLAKKIRAGFEVAISAIPANPLAEVVERMATNNTLFKAAVELERGCYALETTTYDSLSLDARSLLGAALDFVGVDRRVFSQAIPSSKGEPVTEGSKKDRELPEPDSDRHTRKPGEGSGTLL